MNTRFGLIAVALAGLLTWATASLARGSEPVTGYTVLAPEDVKTYLAIFAGEKSGDVRRANALIAKLKDRVLLGYVLLERYLGPHHRSSFEELKSWLEEYGDLVGADRIHRLAMRRAPKSAVVPEPEPMPWRGTSGEVPFPSMSLESEEGERLSAEFRAFARDGQPEAAGALLATLQAGDALPQADIDRLGAYVAMAHLIEMKDLEARAIAEAIIARGGVSAAQCHWIAGLAAYRLGEFAAAASHFEAVLTDGLAPAISAASAFWAARSRMKTGDPGRVLALYARAAIEAETFYGLLATRILGRDPTADFTEPALDPASFAALMKEKPARRAVALWQIGRTEPVEAELSRAFAQISPSLDPAFAALARHLGVPELELRAAEVSARRVRLTSLYPVPPYEPEGGYALDPALLLAFARQESRFRPAALSRAGARGLMQIMPATAVLIARDASLAGENKERLHDPVFSLTLGQRYLRDLLERQNGNLVAIAAAYNAGEGNLSKWRALRESDDDPLLFIETIPRAETRDYIKRVLTNMWMYRLRLGEPLIGLDEVAAGDWPTYTPARTAAAE